MVWGKCGNEKILKTKLCSRKGRKRRRWKERRRSKRGGVWVYCNIYTIINFNLLGGSSYNFNKTLLIDLLIDSSTGWMVLNGETILIQICLFGWMIIYCLPVFQYMHLSGFTKLSSRLWPLLATSIIYTLFWEGSV